MRFPLESTTDYCRKLFYGSTVVTIGLHDLYQSHQSVNHEMSTFKFLHADKIKFSLQNGRSPWPVAVSNMSKRDQSLFSYFTPTAKKKKNEENISGKFNFQFTMIGCKISDPCNSS